MQTKHKLSAPTSALWHLPAAVSAATLPHGAYDSARTAPSGRSLSTPAVYLAPIRKRTQMGLSTYATSYGKVRDVRPANQSMVISPILPANVLVEAVQSETQMQAQNQRRTDAIRAFKAGAGFLGAGAACVILGAVVELRALFDASAILTFFGGMIAADATQRYRDG